MVPRHLKPVSLPAIWVDAREEPRVENAVGGVLYHPGIPGGMIAFSAELPRRLQSQFKRRKKQIFMCEVMGPIIAICTFLPFLLNQEFFIFIDNNPATSAMGFGYSRAPDACRAVGWFWLMCAVYRMAPWSLRVCSAANPSDSVSRMEFEMARTLGWRLVKARIPTDTLFALLKAPTTESAFAGAFSTLGSDKFQEIPVPSQVADLEMKEDEFQAAVRASQRGR